MQKKWSFNDKCNFNLFFPTGTRLGFNDLDQLLEKHHLITVWAFQLSGNLSNNLQGQISTTNVFSDLDMCPCWDIKIICQCVDVSDTSQYKQIFYHGLEQWSSSLYSFHEHWCYSVLNRHLHNNASSRPSLVTGAQKEIPEWKHDQGILVLELLIAVVSRYETNKWLVMCSVLDVCVRGSFPYQHDNVISYSSTWLQLYVKNN